MIIEMCLLSSVPINHNSLSFILVGTYRLISCMLIHHSFISSQAWLYLCGMGILLGAFLYILNTFLSKHSVPRISQSVLTSTYMYHYCQYFMAINFRINSEF